MSNQTGEELLASFNQMSQGLLPGHLGIEFTKLDADNVEAYLQIEKHHLNPSGFLHGGTVVTLADTLAGYATVLNLPNGSTGFTTIELKTNFLSSAKHGKLFGRATPIHIGRSTQVWDVRIWREKDEKTIAEFRCTQLILMPR
ncbi:MAG: PaaI family thioesterase [Robiginitomaculum sp.]|nr:PaaI family thioesterase [Robiginitomaculum sp.]